MTRADTPPLIVRHRLVAVGQLGCVACGARPTLSLNGKRMVVKGIQRPGSPLPMVCEACFLEWLRQHLCKREAAQIQSGGSTC